MTVSEFVAAIGNEKACLGVELKSSVRSEHQNGRGTEWVFRGE
jgi:hypothetical protein